MYLTWMHALLLGAWGAQAFRDTSPFLYFSTAKLALKSPQITPPSSLMSSIESQLLSSDPSGGITCPAHTYIIAVQPGVSAADLSPKDRNLIIKDWLSESAEPFRSTFSVAEVLGGSGPQDLIHLVSSKCTRKPIRVNLDKAQKLDSDYNQKNPRLIVIDLPRVPAGSGREAALRENDRKLISAVSNLDKEDYALFYTTSPPSKYDQAVKSDPLGYEMDDSQSALHMELKRDFSAHGRAEDIKLSDGPLFERYQFLTPGLFMGLLTVLFLAAIGYTGVNALASLEVSYAAFDKENGPQSQRNKAQ